MATDGLAASALALIDLSPDSIRRHNAGHQVAVFL
jgi:hypothetical protein